MFFSEFCNSYLRKTHLFFHRMWSGVIPEKCKQHYKRGEEWQCFFGHKLYSFLSCEFV